MLSLFASTASTTEVYCMLSAKPRLMIQIMLLVYISNTNAKTVQRAEWCFGNMSAIVVQLIVST